MIVRRIISNYERRVEPVAIVYGETAEPVALFLEDYEIPAGATAAAYANNGGTVYTLPARIVDNMVLVTLQEGFFLVGRDELQVEIRAAGAVHKTFSVPVLCRPSISGSVSPSQLTPYSDLVKQVQDALAKIPGDAGMTPEQKRLLGAAMSHQEMRYTYFRKPVSVPAVAPKTVFFGDSIPYGLRVQPDYAWPIILGRWLLGGTPTNLAVGGATWVEFPDIPAHNTVLQQINAAVSTINDAWGVMIMCGYNDWEQGRTYDAIKDAVDTTIKRIDAITSGKNVFIILPIRRCGDEYYGGNVGANVVNDFDGCRDAIAAAVLDNRGSTRNNYILLDGRDIPMSRGTPEMYGVYGDGRPDIVHPSEAGHNLIAVSINNMIPWDKAPGLIASGTISDILYPTYDTAGAATKKYQHMVLNLGDAVYDEIEVYISNSSAASLAVNSAGSAVNTATAYIEALNNPNQWSGAEPFDGGCRRLSNTAYIGGSMTMQTSAWGYGYVRVGYLADGRYSAEMQSGASTRDFKAVIVDRSGEAAWGRVNGLTGAIGIEIDQFFRADTTATYRVYGRRRV